MKEKKIISSLIIKFYDDGTDESSIDVDGKQLAQIIGFLKYTAYSEFNKRKFESFNSICDYYFELMAMGDKHEN